MSLFSKKNTGVHSKTAIQEFHKNPWFFFGMGMIIACSTLFLHSFPKVKALQATKQSIVETRESIVFLDKKIIEAEEEKNLLSERFLLIEDTHTSLMKKIFPEKENIGDLTRFLETFSINLAKKGHMELNAITYGANKNMGEYNILPIRLTFQSNLRNFIWFMQMIKKSGSSLEKDFYNGSPVRLMRIDQVNVSLPQKESGSAKQFYSIGLQISAFYTSPKNDELK